jgi:hypothetical protein
MNDATTKFKEDLNNIVTSGLHPDPEDEISKIQKTFENTIRKNGPDSFNAMMILCDSDYAPALVAEPRPYTTKEDMYVAFAEMLFSYSAFGSACFIMVNDTRITSIDPVGETSTVKDALNISIVSRDSAATVILPYGIINPPNEDKDLMVMWDTDNFICSDTGEDNSQGNLVELYYVMSHLQKAPFSMNTLINYYSFRDFPTVIPEETIAKKVHIEL